jgi:hypothetical protein
VCGEIDELDRRPSMAAATTIEGTAAGGKGAAESMRGAHAVLLRCL